MTIGPSANPRAPDVTCAMRTTALGPPPRAGRLLSIEIAGITDRPNTRGLAQLPLRTSLSTSVAGFTTAEEHVLEVEGYSSEGPAELKSMIRPPTTAILR